MEGLFLISFALTILYIGKISSILTTWTELVDRRNKSTTPFSVSILLPFRNEEENIVSCIQSILASIDHSKNPAIELICINDGSTDDSLERINCIHHPKLVLINSEGQGKKKALLSGIEKSSGELILCTDADCTVGLSWVDSMSEFLYVSQCKMVTGPVSISDTEDFISKWQYLDIIGMMAVTAHGIVRQTYHLANGANMAFRKDAFEAVNGFVGNEKFASGDDVFLIQKINKTWPGQTRFVKNKEAIVKTKAEKDWKALLNQRKRWATKTKGYEEKGVVKLQGFVWFYSLIIVLSFGASGLTSGFSFFTGLLLLFVKMTMDYLLLSKLSNFFGQRKPLKWYIPIGFTYLLYILWAGIHALLPSSYTWKERKVN